MFEKPFSLDFNAPNHPVCIMKNCLATEQRREKRQQESGEVEQCEWSKDKQCFEEMFWI